MPGWVGVHSKHGRELLHAFLVGDTPETVVEDGPTAAGEVAREPDDIVAHKRARLETGGGGQPYNAGIDVGVGPMVRVLLEKLLDVYLPSKREPTFLQFGINGRCWLARFLGTACIVSAAYV